LRYTTQQLRGLWRDYRCDESRMVVTEFGPTRVTVAKPTIDAWLALAQVLGRHDYKIRDLDTGGYVCRKITGGNQPSLHSYGIAVDVNWRTNPYLKTSNRRLVRFSSAATQEERALDVRHDRADTDMTKAMIDDVMEIVTNEGKTIFVWGGDFQTIKDCMHFQLDVSPKELAQGVDWTRLGHGEALPTEDDELHPEEPEAEDFLEQVEPTFMPRSDSMPGLSSEVIAAAQTSHLKWGVPASVSLAQFILESNWGRSMPGGPSSNNPFGIKARAGEPSVAAQTHEVEHGATITIVARFRRFSSLTEAFDAHGALLARGKPYALAMMHKDDPDRFADALTGHYATDPMYGSKLKDLMRRNNLYQYDVGAPPVMLPSIIDDVNWQAPTTSDDDLQTGRSGSRVEALQRQLHDLGYPVGDIDGIFGPLTRGALLAFQADNNIPTTGIVDAETNIAFGQGKQRPLSADRVTMTAKGMAEKGSKTVVNGQNASLLGWLATIFGGTGLANSAAVGIANSAKSTAPAVANAPAAAAETLGSTIQTLQTIVALPGTQPNIKTQFGPLLDTLRTLRHLDPSTLQAANLAPGLQKLHDLLLTPLSVQAVTNAQDLVHRLIDSLGAAGAAVQPAAKAFNTVFDMLGPDALGASTPFIQAAANSVLPGFGGAAATIGIGLLTSLFSNRAVQARVDDHRTGANLRI
jgi:peptidoglycan hydrolase-like protein with peptidoglycan-binding domain